MVLLLIFGSFHHLIAYFCCDNYLNDILIKLCKAQTTFLFDCNGWIMALPFHFFLRILFFSFGVEFTGSQESILQIDGIADHIIENSNASQPLSPRGGGISPMPEIRAIVITNQQRQCLFDSSGDEDNSRASTPNEMTPSLMPKTDFHPTRMTAVPQAVPQPSTSQSQKDDVCVTCGAPRDLQQPSTSKAVTSPKTNH